MCGIGYFPVGPGTVASAVTAAAFLLLWPARLSPMWLLAVAILLLAPCAWAAGLFERRVGRRDPQTVVVDELLGQMIALAAVPAAPAGPAWSYGVLGFILFRIFDILKPFPVRRLERLPGGWGVLVDDYGAGVYAFVAVKLAVAAAR